MDFRRFPKFPDSIAMHSLFFIIRRRRRWWYWCWCWRCCCCCFRCHSITVDFSFPYSLFAGGSASMFMVLSVLAAAVTFSRATHTPNHLTSSTIPSHGISITNELLSLIESEVIKFETCTYRSLPFQYVIISTPQRIAFARFPPFFPSSKHTSNIDGKIFHFMKSYVWTEKTTTAHHKLSSLLRDRGFFLIGNRFNQPFDHICDTWHFKLRKHRELHTQSPWAFTCILQAFFHNVSKIVRLLV